MRSAVAVHPSRPDRRLVLTGRFWVLATALTSLLIAMLPLCWEHRYFFRGDTQVAYSGWWYELGNQALHGRIPLLNPAAWESGNYIAEGQWGLFSPLTILIGVGVKLAPNVVAFVTLLKFALIVAGALGMYFLLRSYRVAPAGAYVGGILVGLGGQSVFVDWPAWANGQMATVLLPWAWLFTRRAMRGRNPLPALIFCYLIVSIGYVYAAIYVAIMIVACLVDAALARDRRAFVRVLAIGVFSALIMVTVYLPGIRTAPVTVRSGFEISSAGSSTVDVSQLFTSMLPTTNRYYLLWCLPLIFWIDPARARSVLREQRDAIVGTAIVLAWVLGPARIGPLRWPNRVLPALMVWLVVLLVVLVARSFRIPGRVPVLASLAWLLAATWIVVSQHWNSRGTTLIGAAVVAAAILLVAWSLRRRNTVAALAVGVCTVAVFVTQHAITPLSPNVVPYDRHAPASADGYRVQIPDARGDVMVLGDYNKRSVMQPGLSKQLLVATAWYRNPANVQNGDSAIQFRAYTNRFCTTYNGFTCPRALKTLLTKQPSTGRPWVDLLSISTLVMYRPSFSAAVLARPPAGWHIAGTSRWTVTWVRDHPVPTAGGVVSRSPGVRIGVSHVGPQSVRFRIDHVPAGGGTVVLSRLDWPGYRVSGASLEAPTENMLVTVRLAPSSAGRTVTVAWSPPGWYAEVAAWWLAVLGGLAWCLALAVLGVRQRRRAAAAVRGSGSVGEDEVPAEPPSRGGREALPEDVDRRVVGQGRVQVEQVARHAEEDS